MPTLPNMGLITPTLGGDSGTWDDKINAAFALVDAHDHTSGKGVPVPVAGLDIDTDLPMGGFAVTGIGSLDFNAVAALAAGARRLFVSSADNELYWRTNAGTNVKLTDGASINTSLVGGIGGDYSTVGAEVAYSDADDVYTLKQETATWARLATGPVRIHQFNTTETVYVEHAVDAALASSYTVTWPAAAPAGTTVMTMTAAGAIVVGSRTVTMSVSTASWKRDDTIEAVAGDGFTQLAGGAWLAPDNTDPTTSYLWIPLSLPVGAILTGYTLSYNKASDGTHTFSVVLMKNAAALRTDAVSTAAPGATTLVVSSGTAIPETVAALSSYAIRIQYTAGADPSADTFTGFDVTYTTTN